MPETVKDNVETTTEETMNEENRAERCFWCGRLKDPNITEEQAEQMGSVIRSYVPCDSCKELFSKGIHVIGVTKEPIIDGMFPISVNGDEKLYPTGSMFVANEEFINDMLSEESEKELKENVLREKILMLPDELVSQIVSDARKAEQGQDLDGYIKEHDGGEPNEENI